MTKKEKRDVLNIINKAFKHEYTAFTLTQQRVRDTVEAFIDCNASVADVEAAIKATSEQRNKKEYALVLLDHIYEEIEAL